MRNFGGIKDKYCKYDEANILLQSIPSDSTCTWGTGAANAFHAFLD